MGKKSYLYFQYVGISIFSGRIFQEDEEYILKIIQFFKLCSENNIIIQELHIKFNETHTLESLNKLYTLVVSLYSNYKILKMILFFSDEINLNRNNCIIFNYRSLKININTLLYEDMEAKIKIIECLLQNSKGLSLRLDNLKLKIIDRYRSFL